jgi:tRNA1(Val) A37 N6-methylase TrmN6
MSGFSTDVFHRGRFHLVQPKEGGHRSGIDAMLLAAAVPHSVGQPETGCLGADLGAGAGAAGFAVMSRFAGVHLTLFEQDPLMIECARQSLALPHNADFARRTAIIEADVTLRGAARQAAGLGDNHFDFAIFNPPYNDPADRKTPDMLKAKAHVMGATLFEDWVRTAAAIVKPGGTMVMIARPQSLDVILQAIGKRFGALEIIPVQPNAESAAIRLIVRGQKGSRAKLRLLPAHVLHTKGEEAFLPLAEAVNNGLAGL